MSIRIRIGLFALAPMCLFGCGGSGYEGPALYPVSGKLTKGGAPLGGVNISLVPTGESKDVPALVAVTKDDGTFTITTSSGLSGAPEGTYKVVIIAPPPEIDYATQQGPPKASDVVPKKYTSAASTDKTFDVGKSGNDLQIDL